MTTLPFLALKHFKRFQHYRNRHPPWIKLYATVLSDPAFLQMPEAAQAQLMKLWVLASQLGHPLPNNQKLLAGRIGTTGRFYLDAMIGAGFVVPCDDEAGADAIAGASDPASTDASNPLAKSEQERQQNATPSVRARALSRERTEDRVQRREIEPSSVSSAREELLSIVPNRRAWEGEFTMAKDGAYGQGLKATDEHIEIAARDYLGNGAAGSPNLAQFRGYLRRVIRGPQPSDEKSPKGNPGAQQVANIMGGRRD